VSEFPSADTLASMVNSVTTTMMNIKFRLVSKPSPIDTFRRAILPIPGTVPVSVVIASDKASCHQLGARLFMVTPQDVDLSMIDDTLRELANITAGQVKRAMSLDQALGLPRIVGAAEKWTSAVADEQSIYLSAEGDVHLEVEIARHTGQN
jgi:hypothetical protein